MVSHLCRVPGPRFGSSLRTIRFIAGSSGVLCIMTTDYYGVQNTRPSIQPIRGHRWSVPSDTTLAHEGTQSPSLPLGLDETGSLQAGVTFPRRKHCGLSPACAFMCRKIALMFLAAFTSRFQLVKHMSEQTLTCHFRVRFGRSPLQSEQVIDVRYSSTILNLQRPSRRRRSPFVGVLA